MARRRKRIVKETKMATQKIGKMEWELFILVIITMILAGAFIFF